VSNPQLKRAVVNCCSHLANTDEKFGDGDFACY